MYTRKKCGKADDSEENRMSEEKTPFLKETVKDEQVTGKRIWRAACQTIGKGLVFGVAACLAFCVLRPFAEDVFRKDKETISIPKDEAGKAEDPESEKETVRSLTLDNYREMNEALYEVAEEARGCVVEISPKEESHNWKEDESAGASVSGIIVWNKGAELLLLAPYGELGQSREVLVQFSDESVCEASLKSVDKNLKFAIFTVEKSRMEPSALGKIKTAVLGNSYLLGKGDSVIALGMPFGYSDGMGVGVISSTENVITVADHKYGIVMTDITASSQGSGVLFNIDGEVVGIVDQRYTNTTDAGLVSGYSISEIKSEIELLSNGKDIPYLGIVGADVTEKISEKEGIPVGLYVKEVEAESPAMEAGIQCGDVVVRMQDTEITSQKAYSKELMDTAVGETVTILVKRQGSKEYEEIAFEAVVGSKK